jgi:hypothetical protein
MKTNPLARLALASLLTGAALIAQAAADEKKEPTWTVMGHQGIVLMVLVPADQAKDEGAYQREIGLICAEQINCFLNFYTNSKSVPVAVPLPDEISHEVTATYRKTYKKGVPLFTWSCRMQMIADSCF